MSLQSAAFRALPRTLRAENMSRIKRLRFMSLDPKKSSELGCDFFVPPRAGDIMH